MKTCDFCGDRSKTGRIVIRCTHIKRSFSACYDCRAAFSDAIGKMLTTGEFYETRVQTRVEPVDRVIVKTVTPPSVLLWSDTVLGFLAGVAITVGVTWAWLKWY